MRTILIVGGGVESVPGIERVARLGLRTIVSDGDPGAPGFDAADERIVASTYDVEATVAAALGRHREGGIDGVLSIAVDVPRTVAAVAERLGLAGIPAEAAELATDKLAMKERFLADGVPVPWFAAVASAAELVQRIAERGLPLVLKPVDSRGARGVLLLRADVDPGWAFGESLRASPSGRVMVEEFVDGPQISTESVILDGEVTTLGCSDRNYDLLDACAPYVVENGGVQPSRLLREILGPIDAVIAAAARSLGVARGTLKGDVVLDPGRGPVVVEVAPRLSGGWFCTDQIPISTGVDLVAVAARLALGEDVAPEEVAPRGFEPVAVRYLLPPPGRLVAVHGLERVASEPFVHRAMLLAPIGATIPPLTNHTARAGVVITTGATREEAVRRAQDAVRSIRIEVAPHRAIQDG